MAARTIINNKFLYYKTLEGFNTDKEAGFIQGGSIAFIEKESAIWTHNKFLYCSAENFSNILEKIIGDPADDHTKNTIFGLISAERKAREDLDSEFEEGDDFITLKITQVDGLITGVEVKTENILPENSILESSTIEKTEEGALEVKVGIKVIGNSISLVDKNSTVLSSIPFSDIVAGGILSGHSYDSTTGKLTLTFTQTGGTTKDSVIDLGKMLDIDDVLIDQESKNYLTVDLTGEEQSQAIFKALVVKMIEASSTNTGLADANDVKEYIEEFLRFKEGKGSGSAILKGTGVVANNEGEVAIGKYNNSVTHDTDDAAKTLFSIGNGSSSTDLHNAMEVRENGDIWINLGSDYKKLQTILSNEIDWYEGQ